jgi:hypothetical protein
VKNSGTEGKCQRATSPQSDRLSQAAGLTLGLEKAEDVVLADCAWLVCTLLAEEGRLRTSALDVTDDGTGLVVHELDTALGDTTTGAYVAVSLRSTHFFCPELCALQHCNRASASSSSSSFCAASVRGSRTGTSKDTSDLDELDGGLSGIHCVRLCVRRETVVRCGFARRGG